MLDARDARKKRQQLITQCFQKSQVAIPGLRSTDRRKGRELRRRAVEGAAQPFGGIRQCGAGDGGAEHVKARAIGALHKPDHALFIAEAGNKRLRQASDRFEKSPSHPSVAPLRPGGVLHTQARRHPSSPNTLRALLRSGANVEGGLFPARVFRAPGPLDIPVPDKEPFFLLAELDWHGLRHGQSGRGKAAGEAARLCRLVEVECHRSRLRTFISQAKLTAMRD